MNPYAMQLPVVYLKPGELFFSEEPCVVVTVLGSCISLAMYARDLGLAGICHALLPTCEEPVCRPGCPHTYRYVDCAVREMVMTFDRRGVRRSDIEVKLAGGADINSSRAGQECMSVGRKNTETASQSIAEHRLSVHSSDVGGRSGRKLIFLTHSGEVLIKRLGRIRATVAEKKTAIHRSLVLVPSSEDCGATSPLRDKL